MSASSNVNAPKGRAPKPTPGQLSLFPLAAPASGGAGPVPTIPSHCLVLDATSFQAGGASIRIAPIEGVDRAAASAAAAAREVPSCDAAEGNLAEPTPEPTVPARTDPAPGIGALVRAPEETAPHDDAADDAADGGGGGSSPTSPAPAAQHGVARRVDVPRFDDPATMQAAEPATRIESPVSPEPADSAVFTGVQAVRELARRHQRLVPP